MPYPVRRRAGGLAKHNPAARRWQQQGEAGQGERHEPRDKLRMTLDGTVDRSTIGIRAVLRRCSFHPRRRAKLRNYAQAFKQLPRPT